MDAFEREYYEILSIGNDGKWKDVQRFYNGDHLEYVCRHMEHNPGDTDSHWHVWKLTYVDGKCTRVQGALVGSVERRTLLGWA